MLSYLVRRILTMVPTLVAISFIVFVIIQLPPGDYLETMISELEAQGESVDPQRIAFLREQYGLDRPFLEQYAHWAFGLLQGNMGYSFEYERPVADVIGDRLWLTMVVAIASIIFVYLVSFPIGI